MDSSKSLLVSFQTTPSSNIEADKDDFDDPSKDISLDYDEDEEMLSNTSPSPKRKTDERGLNESFDPVDDVDIFTVDDSHVDTSGGEIRKQTVKNELTYDVEKFGGPSDVRRYLNPKFKDRGDFTKFLNTDEQRQRRVERAKRFGLDEPSTGSTSRPALIDEPTPEIVSKLYEFYEIDPNNARHKEKYRLNTIYLRGVNRMSTEQIFAYFGNYDPIFMEWIDDSSCNMIWNDQTATARALLGISKPLRRIRPASKPKIDDEQYESPLKRTSPIPEQRRSNSPEAHVDEHGSRILDTDEPIDVDTRHVTVPPGKWRVAKRENPDGFVLMRFATMNDVKTRGAQSKSRYYQEHGNPNFGGQTGIISRSFMNRVSNKRRHDSPEQRQSSTITGSLFQGDLRKSLSDKERWTLLRNDVRRSQDLEPGELIEEKDLETGEVKLIYYSSDEEAAEDDPEQQRSKRPRMRMRADEEEHRKHKKQRQLQDLRSRHSHGAGIDDDWRAAQRQQPRDLRDVLKDSRMRITVANDRKTTRDDLRSRLGRRRGSSDEDN